MLKTLLVLCFFLVGFENKTDQDRDFLDTILKLELSISDATFSELYDWYKQQKKRNHTTIHIHSDHEAMQDYTLLTSLSTSKKTQEICAVLKNDNRWMSVFEKHFQENPLKKETLHNETSLRRKHTINLLFQQNFQNYHKLFNQPLTIKPTWNLEPITQTLTDLVTSNVSFKVHYQTSYQFDGLFWNDDQNNKPPSTITEKVRQVFNNLTFAYQITNGKFCLESNQTILKSKISFQYEARRKYRITKTTTPQRTMRLIAVSIPTHYQNLLEETEHLSRLNSLCDASSEINRKYNIGKTLIATYKKHKCSTKNSIHQLKKNLCQQTLNFIKLKNCLPSKNAY